MKPAERYKINLIVFKSFDNQSNNWNWIVFKYSDPIKTFSTQNSPLLILTRIIISIGSAATKNINSLFWVFFYGCIFLFFQKKIIYENFSNINFGGGGGSSQLPVTADIPKICILAHFYMNRGFSESFVLSPTNLVLTIRVFQFMIPHLFCDQICLNIKTELILAPNLNLQNYCI